MHRRMLEPELPLCVDIGENVGGCGFRVGKDVKQRAEFAETNRDAPNDRRNFLDQSLVVRLIFRECD